ncbi:MAG: GFA family protein [Sphingomonas sp.]|uniref:GFA family protein n=1 Tax=Sphingomonas sp. TaxID=28214 RepID=UPI001B28F564|nr:GFA family protein [Sphingomonas sp.]MBO9621546.1 GFA family protein [Sphingomonas sp.]
MSEPYTGGCKCGAIRYEVSGEPAAMLYCQCRQCQRDSGTGHGAHLTFVGANVKLTGEAATWTVTGDLGTRKSRGFCSACGAPVYLFFPDNADVFVASATSLDDPIRFKPQFVTWTDAGQPWDHLDPALPRFGKMPPV